MEEMIHNLSLTMLSHGCKPCVFAPYVRGKDNSMILPYPVIRYSRPSSKRFGLRQLIIPLLWHHKKYNFDVLHCHGVYPPGYVGALFNKITGIPLIITPHGGDVDVNEKGYIINPKITARIKKTFLSAQAVTAISFYIKEQILNLDAPFNKVHFIPNGVFFNEFKAPKMDQSHTRKDDLYILYLGSLIKRKGVKFLIQAFSAIKRGYPLLRLKIVGEGNDVTNLKEIASKLNLNNNIEFLGIVRGKKKIRLLRNALLLVCPSMREPFGIVILEAFAAGIPVIASKVGGIPDIVHSGENGFLVEPENPQQLAEKIVLLLKDDVLRKKMSENAIKMVANYDWNNVFQKYSEIYTNLLKH